MLTLSQFEFYLPPELIAQTPANPRDQSRLLVLNSQTGETSDKIFADLPDLLSADDVIVRNNTKVFPARLFGTKKTGGKCEVLLLKCLTRSATHEDWECLTRPGVKVGQKVYFTDSAELALEAICLEASGFVRIMRFSLGGPSFLQAVEKIGTTPIPPDIHWSDDDELALREIYQTTYAKIVGSAAAPTAGLHFTPELDEKLRQKGVEILEVTLHVGLGTFANLDEEELRTQQLHSEWFELSQQTAQKINEARSKGKNIVAVGTTTTRVLETCALRSSQAQLQQAGEAAGTKRILLSAQSGETRLMIAPPFKFQVVDKLITNFHYPGSSLLTLVSAIATIPNTTHEFSDFVHSSVGRAYLAAIEKKYRFYSFGDSMLIQRG